MNNIDQEWYEYDDSYVTKVEAAAVMNAEAYVLFYRKNNFNMEPRREELQTYLDQEAGLVKFYISRQWLNKFENFAEPGILYLLMHYIYRNSYRVSHMDRPKCKRFTNNLIF